LAHEILELIVLRDEIGFGVHFESDALGPGHGHADQPFSRSAARLLGGCGKPLGPKHVDGCFHVAAGLVHRLLAVHHAGASSLAKILHVSGGVGHCVYPSRSLFWRAPGPSWSGARQGNSESEPQEASTAPSAVSPAPTSSASGSSSAPISAPLSTMDSRPPF